MASVRRLAANIFTTWFANIFKVATQLVMLPLMARLLGPADMGLYALALPILTFVSLLSDGGLGDSLAREKEMDHRVWSSAFWGLLGSGILLSGFVFGASFVIGAFAGQPKLPMIMLPLASTLLMVAATVIPSALMLRAGRSGFGSLGDLIGYVIGAGLAIVMAFNGFGVWSMVAQYFTTFFIRMVMFNIFSPFRPKLRFDFKALIDHWGIGGSILGGRLADLAGRTMENTLASRSLGAALLGNYSYANQIPRFLSEAVSNPIWHNLYYLSFSGDKEAIPSHYVRHSRMISLIVFPAAIMLAVALPDVVPLLLGPQWTSTIYPMTLLLVTYPFVTLAAQTGAVLYAKGIARPPLIASILMAVARVAVLACLPWIGMHGVAWGLAVINIVYWLGLTLYCQPIIGNTFSAMLLAIAGPIGCAALAGAALYVMLHGKAGIAWLLGCGFAAGLVYIGALFTLDRKRVLMDVAVIKTMVSKRRPVEELG
ncbi:Lipopolysaccharide biosynthesis protein WzxC (plasmid) [Asticcacaulis sp. MM231]|uniref:oligosaccharide flippase family protein n=1 Tax=Asticcacaulis sp. MM231 TaxID=3157666 RepID=UPI0032D56B54